MEKIVIKLSGEIDHHTAPRIKRGLDEAFDKHKPKLIVLDLSGVSFMDSSGIGLLLGRYRPGTGRARSWR